MTAEQAALALSILDPFRGSSLYTDYRRADGWSDAEFDALLATLRAGAGGPTATGPAVNPTTTTADPADAGRPIDLDVQFDDWINGERQAVARTFARRGDPAATVRFALVLAARCSPVVADQFATLVGGEAARLPLPG